MLDFLLSIVQRDNGSYYFSDFGEALIYALIGFVIVFIGIAVIIAVIWLIGFILRKTDNFACFRRRAKKEEPSPSQNAESTAIADDEIPDEVKAAIVAAIMAYYEASAPKCEFKVKRIKRI